MTLFILAVIVALGGWAITIPLLIHDEWVQWRNRRREQKALLGRDRKPSERGVALFGNNVIQIEKSAAFEPSSKRTFDYPHQLVCDPAFDVREKRAILAAWASDRCAVESLPTLRHLPGTSYAVTYASIMDALAQLDRMSGANDDDPRPPPRSIRHVQKLPAAKVAA